MSVYNVLNNPMFVATSLIDMVADEKKRIVASGLASDNNVKTTLGSLSDNIMKIAHVERDWGSVICTLSQLHDVLSSIKLPGDFERLASNPLILDLKNLPRFEDKEYEDKFYDLNGIIEKLKGIQEVINEKPVDIMKKEVEYHEDSDVIHDDVKTAQIVLVEAVGTHLEKIAYTLGRDGNHEAAYLVERTIREIRNNANKA